MTFRALALAALVASPLAARAQSADELVAKNLAARGGVARLRAIHSIRMVGKVSQGGFVAQVGQENKLPDQVRETYAIQGMTQVMAWDGHQGWQINPFNGRRDPELLGEDDVRDLVEDADPLPLLDWQAKGYKVAYLGHATVDGDDALQLNVTLKNGDIFKYYLDPDTSLEIRIERQQFIRGSVRESVFNLGSYKLVDGVYFPFWYESGPKNAPDMMSQTTWDKIEANVELPEAEFKMPPPTAAPHTQPKLPEPPGSEPKPGEKQPPPQKPPEPKPSKK